MYRKSIFIIDTTLIVIDTTLVSDNSSRFRKNLLERI